METTDRYKALRELNDSQLKAVDALLAGQTHAEAAELAGVHRVTVSRWATKHPAFRVELNRRRQELLDQRVDRIRRLDALALDVVSDQLEDRDPAVSGPSSSGVKTSSCVPASMANEENTETLSRVMISGGFASFTAGPPTRPIAHRFGSRSGYPRSAI
ncbi:MAG: hypothetical protein IH818_12085 [Acidobacteria bacterium]|nr:hypothetical protein [Acidobacteriota bacterium]